MAVADEGLELAGSETVQEGDRLSLGDTPEEEASTDEVDPCRKRCGRDHGVVLEECRLAFTTDRVGGTAYGLRHCLRVAFCLSLTFAVRQEKVCGASEIGVRTPSAETQASYLVAWVDNVNLDGIGSRLCPCRLKHVVDDKMAQSRQVQSLCAVITHEHCQHG